MDSIRKSANIQFEKGKYIKLLKRSYIYARAAGDVDCMDEISKYLTDDKVVKAGHVKNELQYFSILFNTDNQVILCEDAKFQIRGLEEKIEFIPDAHKWLKKYIQDDLDNIDCYPPENQKYVEKEPYCYHSCKLRGIVDFFIDPFLEEYIGGKVEKVFQKCVGSLPN
jgi:hypothetical protein